MPRRALDIWSQFFLSDTPDTATCQLPIGLWRMVQDDFPEVSRLIVKITVGQNTVYCALGSPVQPTDTEAPMDSLYVPIWVLQRLGIQGVGEPAKIEWLSQEAFPEATRIILRPLDSAFYDSNMKDVLEVALTRFGVLQTGDTIPIRIESMGDLEMHFDVVLTEPANIVLLEGEEVAIEFENLVLPEAEAAQPEVPFSGLPVAVASQQPEPEQDQEQEDSYDFLPASAPAPAPNLFPGTGHTLGGGQGPHVNPWKRPKDSSPTL